MNLWVPQNAGNYLPSYKPVSFPRRTLLHGVSNAEIKHMKLETELPPAVSMQQPFFRDIIGIYFNNLTKIINSL
jgi:hypothetical protein